jgi:hypothetical protein
MRTHKAVRRQSGESDAVVQNEGASHVLRPRQETANRILPNRPGWLMSRQNLVLSSTQPPAHPQINEGRTEEDSFLRQP